MNTILTGVMGFVLGRLTAPEGPVPVNEWQRPAPAPVVVQLAAPAPAAPVHVTEYVTLVDYPAHAELAALAWRPFDPLADRAKRPDGVPVFPRYGRRWPNEHRAEYLYYLHEGDEAVFAQTQGAPELRDGPGWVLVRDEPGEGWRVSLPLGPEALLALLQQPVPKARTTQAVYPWLPNTRPVALPVDRLAPAGWWAPDAKFGTLLDPGAQYLNFPWVAAQGFTK